MATTVWPITSGTGSKMLAPITVEPIPDVLQSDVDAGRPKRRPLRRKFDERVSCRILITDSEKATFDAWFRDTLVAGVLPFEWTDPTSDGDRDFRFESAPRFALARGETGSIEALWEATLSLRAFA